MRRVVQCRRFDAHDRDRGDAVGKLQRLGAWPECDCAVGRDLGGGRKECDTRAMGIEESQVLRSFPGPENNARQIETRLMRCTADQSQGRQKSGTTDPTDSSLQVPGRSVLYPSR